MKEVTPEPFPWAAVIHLGLGRLRLDPKGFWALSVREVFALLGGLAPKSHLFQRGDLDRLIAAFPDLAPDLERTHHDYG